ncbi:sulfotransferase [Pseudohaliea sp.]|uniref:tetratricopeptide repeat-containing sulfotransferase family protein n=1 Tax=Pseudohaliea sp. TaxID=2740289 RepID=UPI0032EF7048
MAESVQALHRRAQRHLNRGEYAPLAACCKAILSQQQDFADAWFLLSVVAEAAGDLPRAQGLRARALELDGGNAEYLAQQARLLSRLNRNADALAAARSALAAGPANALGFDTAGVVLSRLARYEEARGALAEAVRLAPDNAQYRFNLAAAEQFLGHAEAAETHYRTALALRPAFARAWWALSELRKTGDAAGDLPVLTAQAERTDLSAEDALYLGHALAREHELRGDHAAAFRALEKGKAGRRAKALEGRARDAALFTALRESFRERDRERRSRSGDRANPLFVVGMPRTGTTLVERILSSHEAVTSLGEIQDLAHAVRRSAGTGGSGAVLDPAVVSAALAAPAGAAAAHYLESTAARLEGTAAPGQYLLDKMPLNALYVGFILRSLPGARIVLLRRDPRDTCLSNYRQLFAVDYSYYDYHYDLESTAHYVAAFERLMGHWQSLYGDRVHSLHYEALVADPESEVRSLLTYLDLPWEPLCLAFHQNAGGVATPSALQVRKPLYRDALARWRRYEKELAPATAILAEAGVLPPAAGA